MKIQDLSKELSHEERAVCGGVSANLGSIGAPAFFQAGAGTNLLSPTIGVEVFTPIVTQVNVDPTVTTVNDTKIASVLASANSLIGL